MVNTSIFAQTLTPKILNIFVILKDIQTRLGPLDYAYKSGYCIKLSIVLC